MDNTPPFAFKSLSQYHRKSIARRRNLTQQVLRYGTLAAVLGASHALGNRDPTVKLRRNRTNRRPQCTWVNDYLSENALYSRRQFRKLFRVPRRLFERLHDGLTKHDPDRWATRFNAARQWGIDSRVKVLVSLKVLGTGRGNHDKEEGARIGVETARIYFRAFCQHVVELYGPTYLNRRPSPEELARIERGYASLGLKGCVGVVQCCRIGWKNCPFKKKHKATSTTRVANFKVEAWCDRDLYLWSWFTSKHVNDTRANLLADSPLFDEIFKSAFPLRLPQPYTLISKDEDRQMPYFLVNDKYPEWPIFAKPFSNVTTVDESNISKQHEELRDQMRKTIGVLKNRFQFLRRDCFLWYQDDIIRAFKTCVILHNMLVEMAHKGEFFEDELEEGCSLNLITELYDEEGTKDFEVINEMGYPTDGTSGGYYSDEGDDDGGAASLSVTDEQLTSSPAFASLRRDLVISFANHAAKEAQLSQQPSNTSPGP